MWKKFDLAKLAFGVSVAFGIFLIGGVFGTKEWHPYQMFEDGYKAARALVKQQNQTRPDNLKKRQYEGDGITRHDRARAYDGYTLMQGWFAEGIELRLVDMVGNVLNRWPVDFFKIWPNPNHIFPRKNIPAGRFNYHTQGMWLLPDGSVVFNFGPEKGTVKMDKCGAVQWTVDRMTHHSITPNPDGSFWIPAKGDVREVPDALLYRKDLRDALMDSSGRYEDRLLLIGSNGKIEKEFSVLQALIDGGFERELFNAIMISPLDPTHINDIEVVNLSLARKIGDVQSGDLLISIKHMDMLAILDKSTGRIKWHHVGPWMLQHDPDITDQGTIEVFNNGCKLNFCRTAGSSLLSLDPATRQTSLLYPGPGQENFYTDVMGTHQLLANGNRLIAESNAGRVFEIDAQGDTVWEYIKPYDESHATEIESAIRYDRDYFVVEDWNCR